MKELVTKAESYIFSNSTSLQNACMNYIKGDGKKEDIVKELAVYQNTDGGWANGLEIEYTGTASTPYTTAAALGYICKFGLAEYEIFDKTLAYLRSTQHANGMWDDTDEILKFPHPPYMGPGIYTEFKTGMIVKWLLRLNVTDKTMINAAQRYLLETFDEIAPKNDFWSAVGYSNAFSLTPEAPRYAEIMEWSMKILVPQEGQFGWQQVTGMIEDDTPIPEQAYDLSISLIKQNQEEDGGWPHMFGAYNRVWAALFILRFLKSKGLVYQE